jgi:CheY-like chemotaxis protein
LTNAVTISVKDNGVGIALDIQAFIFDLFRQGPRSLDRSQGGLGIGLSLVRTIVEMHGGTANVRSAGAGTGSEFIVLLPVSAALVPDHDIPLLKTTSAQRCRILLIDDNTDANETLNDLLAIEGHTITSTYDGTSGLAMALENVYDIIVCDIGLPGMDGYEVVTQLRLNSIGRRMPMLIALSGYNQLENRTRAEEVGFDHYLVKPVAIDALLNLITPTVLQ